jgi:hypothetical protein
MKGTGFFTTTTVVLTLGFADTAWALWSPEQADSINLKPVPTATQSLLSIENQGVLGYTPPLDLREMESGNDKQNGDPVIRRLAAVQAREAIEIPFVSAIEAADLETFTRVNPSGDPKEPNPAGAGDATEIPVPSPAAIWLMLLALPSLLLAHHSWRRTG